MRRAFFRRHPIPFGLLCAALALYLASGVLLVTGSAHQQLFFWAGWVCGMAGIVGIGIARKRELPAGTSGGSH